MKFIVFNKQPLMNYYSIDGGNLMNDQQLTGILESLLFVSGSDGLSIRQVRTILEIDEDQAVTLLKKLQADYQDDGRGIQLIEAEATYYLTTKKDHADYLQSLVTSNKKNKLSQASLETLAIIAYNQPLTRLEIEEVRGVKSDRSVQTLLSRGLIEEAGKKDTIGRPHLYKTTLEFLTYFGLKSIEELPPLTDQLDDLDFNDELDLFFNDAESDSAE